MQIRCTDRAERCIKTKIMVRTITDENSGKQYNYSMMHSNHSKKRAAQRGFTETDILDALDYSEVIRKQGLFFYTVTNSKLPDALPEKRRKKLNNLVVVVSGDSDSIITCYKSRNNIKHIKKKGIILK